MTCSEHQEALVEKLARAKPFLPKKRESSNEKHPPAERWMRIIRHTSTGGAITNWLFRCVNAGHPKVFTRSKALLSWAIRLPLRGWQLGRAYSGPRVSLDEFQKRMAVCEDCQSMQLRLIRESPFTELYCSSCRCPRWRASELRYKNRLLSWECPANKHERLNDPPEWAALIENERTWAKTAPDEAEVTPVPAPPMRQDFGQPKRGCGG